MLHLLRHSKLLALAAIVAVAAALTWLYRSQVVESLVESETRSNTALTQTFVNAMWPSHAAFVASAGRFPRSELARRPEIAWLKADLRQLSERLNVVKIKVYDRHGLTVFSSDLGQIGEDRSANPGFVSARNGTVVSEITYRNSFSAFEGEISDRNIIGTYVPVRAHAGAPVEAVVEVYSDVTALVERLALGQWRVMGGVASTMALLFLLVQFILERYRRVVGDQEAARAAQEERIRYQAYHDPLTGLPNRASFTEQLQAAMGRARRSGMQLALLFVDLDQFKRVNDSLGHDAGDRLLRVVAERIAGALREADQLFRMGGDEFTVLLHDLRNADEAATVARRMITAISEQLQLGHHELAVSASIGIAMYPSDEDSGERLVKAADTAMYRAKELGRSRHAFFSPEMNQRLDQQIAMEAALRGALRRGEFELQYQPRISAGNGRVVGVEALLRWRHPEWGLLEPGRFVPSLEETGLIVPVGAWVLKEACRQGRGWRDAGLDSLRVSVNLSPRQFRSDTLLQSVWEALAESGLPPACLELELTESLLVDDVERAMSVMAGLKSMGTVLSIDDFGTGYSSFAYLKRFPIDTLKIDQSFVRDLATSRKDAAIVEAISALAHKLGVGLVAEGVENHWQADFLRARYCTELQGYLFSRPVVGAEIPETLARLREGGTRARRPFLPQAA